MPKLSQNIKIFIAHMEFEQCLFYKSRCINPLTAITAYMSHGNNNITIWKQIIVQCNFTAIHPIV